LDFWVAELAKSFGGKHDITGMAAKVAESLGGFRYERTPIFNLDKALVLFDDKELVGQRHFRMDTSPKRKRGNNLRHFLENSLACASGLYLLGILTEVALSN